MHVFIYLLAAYGLVFGVQNKISTLQYWTLNDLLECPYCLGFWMGWFTWGFSWMLAPVWNSYPVWGDYPLEGIIWAFATAAFCQIVDELVRRNEGK